MHNKSDAPPFVVRMLERFLRKTGYFVANHHYLVLFLTLAFTTVCSVKILFTPQQDDIKTGYTPFGAPSIREMATYNEFFALEGDPIGIYLLLTANDGGSMHRKDYIGEAIRIIDYVSQNITHLGKSYEQICSNWCLINEPVRQFANGIFLGAGGNESISRVRLTFPIMEILGKQLDLSANFFGVHKDEEQRVTFLRVIGLQLRADLPKGWSQEDVKTYERSVSEFLHKKLNSTRVEAYALSLTFTADEIVRTGMTIFPFIAVGFLIMCSFSIVTVIISSVYLRQPFRDRLSMAIFGCVCPLLATSTALGLLFWLGFRFGSILCVTPFLILAIGVDDAYLTIQSWIRMKEVPMVHSERIATVLVDVGPSITITSLTNALAFIVGIYTPTPEIQLFCIGNAVAITMFIAILSIAGERETKAEETKKQKMEEDKCQRPALNVGNQVELSRLLEAYSDWIANGFTTFVIGTCLILYWWMSIRGALSIRILLSPDKLVLHDSKLIEMNHLRERYISPNYTTVNLFINKPGNLEDTRQLNYVRSAIEAFESYPECLGAPFSHFWLRDYEGFIKAGGAEEGEDYEDTSVNATQEGNFTKKALKAFLEWPEFKHLSNFIKFTPSGTIDRFFATVAYKGDRLGSFDGQGELIRRWRITAEHFTPIDLVTFSDNSQFVDQISTILPATLSTSFATLLCMMVVCFLFMYNVFTVIIASLSIASICIGVFGLLSYWGIDLDPISMATTIMSIGFSVDFPAHVTYHYFREGLEDNQASPNKRIARALVSIGFPLLQCGLSTILFVCCLLFVDTYMSEVFVKTMILIVSLGLVHALLVVPVFLCALSNLNSILCYKSSDTQSLSSFARILRWGGVSPSSSDNKIPSS